MSYFFPHDDENARVNGMHTVEEKKIVRSYENIHNWLHLPLTFPIGVIGVRKELWIGNLKSGRREENGKV